MKELITIDMIELTKLIGLSFALIIFMVVNIIFGTMLADMKNEWNKEKLIKGIKKSFAIAIGVVLIYVGGLFVPNLAVVRINEEALTVNLALDVIFTGAVVLYACKSIKNLAILIGIKMEVNETISNEEPIETEYVDSEV